MIHSYNLIIFIVAIIFFTSCRSEGEVLMALPKEDTKYFLDHNLYTIQDNSINAYCMLQGSKWNNVKAGTIIGWVWGENITLFDN